MSRRNVWRSFVTSILAAGVMAACSDEGGDGGIVGADAPDMLTDVSELVFVEVAQGSEDTQTINVFNIGKGELRLDSIKLFETTTTDVGSEFAKGDDWINAAALGPDETLTLSVRYAPRDKHPDEGYIELQTNDPKFEDGIARIPLKTPGLSPRVYSRQTITFRRVPPVTEETRGKFWQLTEVENIGSAPLDINDIVVVPDNSDFSFSFPESTDIEADPADDAEDHPRTLEPGESFPMRVYFNPADDLPSTAEILIYSNDQVSSEYPINLIGNSGAPCLQLSEEEEINFGEGAIGFASNKTIIVTNCSPSSELEIPSIEVCTEVEGQCEAAGVFQVKEGSLPTPLPDETLVLEPEQTETFVLTYTPTDTTVSTGRVVVESNDPVKEQLVVPVVGKGTDNQCPQAVASAALSGSNRWQTQLNTVPLKTVNFRATESVDPDGAVQSYEWHVLQRPTGSTATMAPSPNVAEPTLFLDLAGEYVIELKVFDERGTESCGDQALIHITAVPDERLHIQLVWSTPADPDETDWFGSDVDLHFLHPFGTWNEGPWDIYWLNTEADWGVPGDPTDDPSLDIDDTDGAGPENVNLDQPEQGLDYEVGVYYFSDGGFGPSYATVRVFIDGAQQYEKEKLLQTSGVFWHVGTISWPAATVTPTDYTQQDFP